MDTIKICESLDESTKSCITGVAGVLEGEIYGENGVYNEIDKLHTEMHSEIDALVTILEGELYGEDGVLYIEIYGENGVYDTMYSEIDALYTYIDNIECPNIYTFNIKNVETMNFIN
jgi:hypothetical protein